MSPQVQRLPIRAQICVLHRAVFGHPRLQARAYLGREIPDPTIAKCSAHVLLSSAELERTYDL